MELGNLVFGHSRGNYPVPRTDEYEEPFAKLIGKITGEESCYVPEFSNDTFEMHPYWWGDCDCGFEQKEEEWDKQNKHTDDCFFTRYREESERLEKTGLSFWEAHNAMTKWSKDNGYPNAPNGMAIHCDCGRVEKWNVFVESNQHLPTCGAVRPNFLFKPLGYELRVYKYALRDSYQSHKLNPKQFREMIDACISSLEDK